MPVPPKLLRRAVLAPLLCVLEAALLLISPVLFLLAVLASPMFGGWRPVRLLAIVISGAARHLATMLACAALWVASGFGWKMGSPAMRRAHYALMRWFATGLYRTIVRVARVEVTVRDSSAAERALATAGRPVVVLSRHAGEGDTLLVIHQLLSRYDRGPRLVMNRALRLDPVIDMLGERLPNRFLDPRGGDTEKDIAALAGELGETAALVIFPEGANFTERRRQRGIERLDDAGHHEQAEWARGMRHVSAPRPGGTLAAIGSAPDADVVVIGHAGFPTGFRELWDLLPEKQSVEVRMWHARASDLPADHDQRIDWLFGRWRDLDQWIDECHRARELAGG